MYCSECGTRVSEKEKFCKKCGKSTGKKVESSTSSDNKEIAVPDDSKDSKLVIEVHGDQRPKQKWTAFGCFSIVFFFMIMIAIFVMSINAGDTNASHQANNALVQKDAWYLCIPFLVIFVIWGTASLFKKWGLSFKEHPWKASLFVAFPIIVTIFILSIAASIVSDAKVQAYDTFQDSFADVLTAKYLGDDIVAGKTSTDFKIVKEMTQKAVDTMALSKLSGANQSYSDAVVDWAGKINKAAASKNSWKNLPDVPTVKIATNGPDVDTYYEESLNRVATNKDFGDWAVAKGDKDAMRQIAGQIEAEAAWQSMLTDSVVTYDPGLVDTAYAKSSTGIGVTASFRSGGCRGIKACHSKTAPIIRNLSSAARNYSAGDGDARTAWNDGWVQMTNVIDIAGNNYVVMSGVVKFGPPDTTKPSPMEQAFADQCTAKGGTIGGTGGVYDRLPTTNTSGWACHYPSGSSQCWDILTYAGRNLMGGDAACPEKNLQPKASEPATTTTPTTTTKSSSSGKTTTKTTTTTTTPSANQWDGNYAITYSVQHCENNLPDASQQAIFNSTLTSALNGSDSLRVSGGKTQNNDGTTSTISSDGDAAWTASISGVGASFTYHFSGSRVSGSVVVSESISGMSVSCTETISGGK